jgi:arsenate reductase
MFSNTFAGIAPSSAPVFIAAQIGGGVAGVLLIRLLYPALTPAQAAAAVVPRETAGLDLAAGNGDRPARAPSAPADIQ